MDVTTRVRLEQQGYQLDDVTHAEVDRWLRLAPMVCSAAALAGTLAGEPVAFFVMAPLGIVGALTGRHPLEWVADRTVRRRRSHLVPIPLAGAPRRFAYAVAATWLMVTGTAFLAGITIVAAGLGLVFTLATGIAAATGLCPACVYWHQRQRSRQARARDDGRNGVRGGRRAGRGDPDTWP